MLGTTHTPWGARIAGNKEGTIPAYDRPGQAAGQLRPEERRACGPIPSPPRSRCSRSTRRTSTQHADKLSEGVKAMLKKYPSYRIDVYPSHRIANYPPFVIENMKKNASRRVQDDQERPGHRGLLRRPAVPVPEDRQRGDVEPAAEVRHHRLLLGRT